jgi:hypothetical protein
MVVGSVNRLEELAKAEELDSKVVIIAGDLNFVSVSSFAMFTSHLVLVLRSWEAQSFDLLMTCRLRVANECFSSRGGSRSGCNALPFREQGSLLRVETSKKESNTQRFCPVNPLNRILVCFWS